MKYNITLADSNDDHWTSQARTGAALRKAGFAKVKWNMGSFRENGKSLHRWYCEGDNDSLLILKLSADVEKIEEIKEETTS
jgi:hypothetical protein